MWKIWNGNWRIAIFFLGVFPIPIETNTSMISMGMTEGKGTLSERKHEINLDFKTWPFLFLKMTILLAVHCECGCVCNRLDETEPSTTQATDTTTHNRPAYQDILAAPHPDIYCIDRRIDHYFPCDGIAVHCLIKCDGKCFSFQIQTKNI